jgi:O-antigen ligase
VLLASVSLFWTSSLDTGAFSVIDVALPFGALAALVGSLGLERVAPLRLARLQVALALLFSLVAVYQWQSHHLISNRKLEVDNAYASFYRVNSLFFDPSLFGRFQAIAILTLVGVLLLARRALHPALLVLASAGVFVGLALSYSQSSLLALDIGLVVLAGIVWRGRAVVGFGALAVLVLLASLAVPTTRHKIFHTSLSGITSNRSSILSKGIDAFRRHPLIGSGLGSFAHAAGTTPEERARIAPHNVVLQEAVELGVLGLAALAGIVFAVLRLLLRPADASRQRALRLILGCELAAIVVSSLFYASLFEDPIAWVAAALIALCAVPSRQAADIARPAIG